MKINRDKLEYLMTIRGLNNKELARSAGIQASLLSCIKARGTCRYSTAKRLARVVGWDFIEHPGANLDRETAERWRQQYETATHELLQRQAVEAAREVRHKADDAPGEYERIILEFINRQVPVKWNRFPITGRRLFWDGESRTTASLVDRDRVCAAEVWCEAFKCSPQSLGNKDTMRINSVIASAPGWIKSSGVLRFGPYGVCRGFVKVKQTK